MRLDAKCSFSDVCVCVCEFRSRSYRVPTPCPVTPWHFGSGLDKWTWAMCVEMCLCVGVWVCGCQLAWQFNKPMLLLLAVMSYSYRSTDQPSGQASKSSASIFTSCPGQPTSNNNHWMTKEIVKNCQKSIFIWDKKLWREKKKQWRSRNHRRSLNMLSVVGA